MKRKRLENPPTNISAAVRFMLRTCHECEVLSLKFIYSQIHSSSKENADKVELKLPTYPIEQNRTKNQSNPIELQSFDWVGQSNKIEQNRTNPMQLSLDASN